VASPFTERREFVSQTPLDPAPGTGEDAGPQRRLLRARDDRVLFGVCGGLGRYVGVDPTIVRIVFVLLVVFGGSGILLYLVGLVAMPVEEPGAAAGERPATSPVAATVILGAALVAIGSLMLVSRLIPDFGSFFGPLLLVAVGVAVILGVRR
jgi:phage shock protein C